MTIVMRTMLVMEGTCMVVVFFSSILYVSLLFYFVFMNHSQVLSWAVLIFLSNILADEKS